MKITCLIENTQGSCCSKYEHGLSYLVETERHVLLSDTGASDAFLKNADEMGINMETIDLTILSHGHYDHAGGISALAERNPKTKILMQRSAAEDYYHKSETEERYIGIDKQLLHLPQVMLLDGNITLDEELSIFTNVTGRRYFPVGNAALKQKINDAFVPDSFAHEQYIVLQERGKRVLISGCAHHGIVNILDTFTALYGGVPDGVFSGFHMKKTTEYTPKEIESIRAAARELKKMSTIFYTGHCTGETAFGILKEEMGEQIQYCHSGDSVII